MYRIKSNLDVNGRNWGMDFVHGEAFTEREDLARRLKSLGYLVEEMPKTPAEQPKTPPAAAPALTPEAAPATETPAAEAPEAPEAPEALEAPPEETGKLTCPICGKVCGSQAVLTRHTNKEHK